MIALEDEAEFLAAQARKLVRIEFRNVVACEEIASACRPIEAAQNVHQRRFAGARLAHDRHELAGINIERDAAQRLHLHFAARRHEGPAHIVQRKQRRACAGGRESLGLLVQCKPPKPPMPGGRLVVPVRAAGAAAVVVLVCFTPVTTVSPG